MASLSRAFFKSQAGEASHVGIVEKKDAAKQGVRSGAANRTRTCDPLITNQVLYQLSYGGLRSAAFATL